MLYLIGVVIFAGGLLLSIALHEVGHMVPAKKFGVKVTQYMVGFGPTVWSRRRGDTEYGLKAIPLGGYIRMIGMVPPRADGNVSRWPRRMATAVEDFRAVSRAEVQPADEDRQFYRLTPGKKMIVMIGGPAMNFVIYAVLTVLLLTLIGIKGPTRTINAISECLQPATSTATSCPADAPRAPAYNVLQPGDQIEAIDGAAVSSWASAVKVIENSAGRQLALTVNRNGVEQTVTVTPAENLKYANDTGTATKEAGMIGIETTLEYQSVPIAQVPGQIVSQLAQSLHALANYPAKIGNLFGTVFEGKARDPQGAIGIVGLGRIGGDIADSNKLALLDKIYALFGLLASVNLLLFLFNLLPLLPLDGGHVAGALVEAAKRGRARLRARRALTTGRGGGGGAPPPPQEKIYVDTAQMLPVMYGVGAFLIVISVLILYADIVSPVNLGL